MRKILLMIAFAMATVCANAQIMRVDELEKYAKEKYGDKWAEAAVSMKSAVYSIHFAYIMFGKHYLSQT